MGCNNECSQSRLFKLKDNLEDANLSRGSVHERTLDCIDPRLLARHIHEPQIMSLSRLDTFTGRISADNSQPQSFSKLPPYDAQRPLHTPTPIMRAIGQPNDTSEEFYPSPSSLPCSGQFTPQTTTLSDVDQACSDASDGKMILLRTTTNSVCRKCKRSFPNRSVYHLHIKDRSCQALSKCKHCSKSFKLAKDLKRHLGSDKALPSCNKLESSSYFTGFACTCHKSYTRKDSLMRHLKAPSLEGHRCMAFNKNPCYCS